MGHGFARVAVWGVVCALFGNCGPAGPVDVKRPAPDRAGMKDAGRPVDAGGRGAGGSAGPMTTPGNPPVDVPIMPGPGPTPSPDAPPSVPDPLPPPPADAPPALPGPPDAPVDAPAPTPPPTLPPLTPPPTPPPAPDAPVDRPTVAPPVIQPLQGCAPLPAGDERIADFEDGTTVSTLVGVRGGTRWSVIADGDGAAAAVAAVPIEARCGSTRAMRFAGTATAERSPITRLQLMSGTQFFDASAFRGITFSARASAPMQIRVKVPDRATATAGKLCVECSDHFAATLELGTAFRSWFVPFAGLRQTGSGDPRPALTTTALFGFEFTSARGTAFEIFIDDLNFLR